MGRPPPHIAFKRIVKSYFKKKLPQSLPETSEAYQKLFDCWEQHGVESDACRQMENAYQDALEYEIAYKNYIKQLNFPRIAMQHLAPAKRKYEGKGKHQSHLFYNQETSRFRLRNIKLTPDK